MKWKTVSLGELSSITYGFAWSSKEFNFEPGGLRIIRIQDLDQSPIARPVYWTGRYDAKYLVQDGDLLLSLSGSFKTTIWKGSSALLNQRIAKIEPRSTVVEKSFIYYLLTTKAPEIIQLSSQTSVKNLSASDLENLPIPLPPLDEQRRIVEILDQADRLRKLRRQADAIAERILPALFYKMFGDPVRNEKGWEKETLGSLSVLGPQYGANASSIKWEPGMARYVRITDINDDGSLRNDELRSLDTEDWEEFVLYDGDIVFARSGATVGKAYIHRGSNYPHVFAGYLIRFRLDPSRVNPWVVFGLTQTSYYRAWVAARKRTAAQPNINGQEYATLMIPVPPKELQEEYATLVERILKMQTQQKASSRTVEDLFTSLLHRAFTGELTKRWREEQKVV